jgi:methylphosphotriester-DNA--protein-cysteine methyltransferase
MVTSDEGKKLRAAIATRANQRHRLSAELRARAATYARERKASGATAAAIAAELGVSQPTVARWLGRSIGTGPIAISNATRSRALRKVVVEQSAGRTLHVVSPSGYRIDGLSLQEAAMLLRVLG